MKEALNFHRKKFKLVVGADSHMALTVHIKFQEFLKSTSKQ